MNTPKTSASSIRLALLGALLLGFRPGNVTASSPFLDSMFGFQITSGIVYGTGDLGYPTLTGTMDLRLDLYQPTGVGLPPRLPALIAIHGGGFINNDRTEASIVDFSKRYAQRGYVVASIDYRLVGDDPAAEAGPFSNLQVINRTRNAAAQDAAKAVRWLRANAAAWNIDPDRIGIVGASAGGVTALLEGYQEGDVIGAGAEVGAIVDLWGGMYGKENRVEVGDPPVFIVHGTADTTVDIQESLDLTARCDAIGLEYEFYPIEGAGHGCWGAFWDNVVEGKKIDRRCAEFLFRNLGLLALHPAAAEPLQVSQISSGGAATLSIPSDASFLYRVEHSTDLVEWSSVGMPPEVRGVDSLQTFQVPAPGGSRAFYRMILKEGF